MSTIPFDDNLLREVEELAARSHRSVQTIVEDAVRAMLPPAKTNGVRTGFLPTFGGSGVQPGVDISNSAALLDIMDAPE